MTRRAPPRAIGIALWVVMALAGSPQSGIAQERSRSASPEELWRDYPLEADEKAGDTGGRDEGAPAGAEPGRARPAVEQSGDGASAPPEAGSDDESTAAPVVIVLGLLVVGLLVLLGLRRRFDVRELLRRARAGRSPPDGPADPEASDPPGASRAWAALRSSAWTAEIQWRNDAGASRFCVVASPPGGEDELTLAESPGLAWPPRDEAAVDLLVGAVAELERSVVAAGWEVTEPGSSWFAKRFVWPRSDRAPERTLQQAAQRA